MTMRGGLSRTKSRGAKLPSPSRDTVTRPLTEVTRISSRAWAGSRRERTGDVTGADATTGADEAGRTAGGEVSAAEATVASLPVSNVTARPCPTVRTSYR